MKLTRKQHILTAIFCLTLLGVTVWVMYAEYDRPWKEYQKEFNKLEYSVTARQYQKQLNKKQEVVKSHLRSESLDRELSLIKKKLGIIPNRKVKIRQLWLQELGIIDRCITCHQGADTAGFENMPQPYRTHSGNYLRYHSIERFGCVACHDGQGSALTVDTAHGYAENWSKPILKGPYAQSSCGKCHSPEQEFPQRSELTQASSYLYGLRLFQDYNCMGCHEISGYERPDHIAPSLTLIGSKVNQDWLIDWLKNPRNYMSNAKMPRFKLGSEEISNVASYLLSLKSSDAESGRGVLQYAPAGLVRYSDESALEKGEMLVNSLGCLGCHKIDEKGNDFAPAFSSIGSKVNPDWLFNFIRRPKSYDPKMIIPDFMIPEKDILSIVAYLMSLKKKKGNTSHSPPLSPVQVDSDRQGRGGTLAGDIEKGRKLVKNLGCRGCHEIEKLPSQYNAPALDGIGDKRVDQLFFYNVSDVRKTLVNWLNIKVMDPERFATDKIVAKMPNYDFSEKQGEALVTFLLSIKDSPVPSLYRKRQLDPDKTEMSGRQLLEKYNCLGCHKIRNEGGDIGPDLTDIIKKDRPEWLFGFLKRPHKIRPIQILKARMPLYNLSDEEVNTIIEYFAFLNVASYPYNFEVKKKIYPEDIRDGEKLYHEVFACSGCHSVNGQGGEIGPEHTDLASRLTRDWIEQWLQNPQAIKPDVRMPRFTFKGWEFEALTNYLMTLGKFRFVQVKRE